ncbi:MAG: ParA family protein [Spirochaetes bacterium]|jgi:chromosome partitioning protein|nr:ParA family protein [Spirochaetota bacterium]HNV43822.1 ParA family protein [Exilispira sp.]MBP8991841.1 ParA family protein [Spirochaetota bacterium]HOV46571.1 ParA family protein [Exilispira sp.]HPO60850.1 ParA family protein [Exilispira sp.]
MKSNDDIQKLMTLNFKGGVGKTTLTFLLARYFSENQKKKVILFDLDPQMNLTYLLLFDGRDSFTAEKIARWYYEYEHGNYNIVKAIKVFYEGKNWNSFPVKKMFIKINENLYFIPSIIQLYWFDLYNKRLKKIDEFITSLVEKILQEEQFSTSEYFLFDSPPAITYLSLSTLNFCNKIIIPMVPHVFAARGLNLILSTMRILEISEDKELFILLNKAREYKNYLSNDNKKILDQSRKIITNWSKEWKGKISICSEYIKEDSDIAKISQSKRIPDGMKNIFENISKEIGFL